MGLIASVAGLRPLLLWCEHTHISYECGFFSIDFRISKLLMVLGVGGGHHGRGVQEVVRPNSISVLIFS